MQNSERKTISLEEIEDIAREALKESTQRSTCGCIIIPGPKFEECMHNHLVNHFNNIKENGYQETNTKGKDSQVILLCT